MSKMSDSVALGQVDLEKVNDPVVTAALNYIHENVRRPIQAMDIADNISVSRSSLYRRFRERLGCSVYDMIKTIRIQALSEVLVGTNHSINQISEEFGYECSAHIARYFSAATGMTPTTYRSKYRM